MGGNRTGAVQHRGLGEIDIIGSAALMHNAARRPLSRNGHRLTARRRGIPVTPRKQNQAAGPVADPPLGVLSGRLGRAKGGDLSGFAEHLVDFARVQLLGVDHLAGILFQDDRPSFGAF